jgi:hypothetical protein
VAVSSPGAGHNAEGEQGVSGGCLAGARAAKALVTEECQSRR